VRKRRIYLGLIGIGVVVGVIVVLPKPEREPVYGGKKLSEWVLEFRTSWSKTEETDEAVRHIGTNAIPYLVKWMSYEPAPWRIKLYEGLPAFCRGPFNGWIRKDKLALCAFRALEKLGPNSQAGVPELVSLLNDPRRNYSAGRAAMALGSLGDEYLPTLLAALTNRPTVRGAILIGISSMGTNARTAVPALTNLLNDPDLAVRRIAATVLRRIDPQTVKTNTAQ